MGERGELRKEMLRVLENLDQRWLPAASREVSKHLETFFGREVVSERIQILAFIPLTGGEPDVTSFLTGQFNDRDIFLPRILPDKKLQFWKVSQEVLHGGADPDVSESEPFDPHFGSVSVVLVPGVAFDRSGRRLARGAALYDDFLLQQGMHHAMKIGVGWEFQLLNSIPSGGLGASMDWVCHENGLVRTGLLDEGEI